MPQAPQPTPLSDTVKHAQDSINSSISKLTDGFKKPKSSEN